MIQGFMKQSNGTVRFYTEPGQGATFKLYFKAHSGLDVDSAKKTGAAIETSSERARILVVENEAAVLAVIAATLEKTGYRITIAISGDEAKAIFQNDPPFDLLLTDIVMPRRQKGTSLAKELRAVAPKLPVVFMSGYASEATVHGNGLRPEDIRLMKPVRRADLVAAIEKALSNPGKLAN